MRKILLTAGLCALLLFAAAGCLHQEGPQPNAPETTGAETQPVLESQTAHTAAHELGEDECGEALTWTLSSGGTLTISGEGDMYDFQTAPWNPDRLNIYRIEVKSGVTGVGDNAFAFCEKAYSVQLPDTLERIGKGAFSGCAKLSSVRIPDGVQTVPERCFESCSALWSVTLPGSVLEIGDRAFNLCDHLSDAKLPDGLEKIGDEAFAFCERIYSCKIPATMTHLGKNAFVRCSRLSAY